MSFPPRSFFINRLPTLDISSIPNDVTPDTSTPKLITLPAVIYPCFARRLNASHTAALARYTEYLAGRNVLYAHIQNHRLNPQSTPIEFETQKMKLAKDTRAKLEEFIVAHAMYRHEHEGNRVYLEILSGNPEHMGKREVIKGKWLVIGGLMWKHEMKKVYGDDWVDTKQWEKEWWQSEWEKMYGYKEWTTGDRKKEWEMNTPKKGREKECREGGKTIKEAARKNRGGDLEDEEWEDSD